MKILQIILRMKNPWAIKKIHMFLLTLRNVRMSLPGWIAGKPYALSERDFIFEFKATHPPCYCIHSFVLLF